MKPPRFIPFLDRPKLPKVCFLCEGIAPEKLWICRACGRRVCAHFSSLKDNGSATCVKCIK